MTVELKVGKMYRASNGREYPVIGYDNSCEYEFLGKNGMSWAESGCYFRDEEHPLDLIEEIPGPYEVWVNFYDGDDLSFHTSKESAVGRHYRTVNTLCNRGL
jgi:hypothetical protein